MSESTDILVSHLGQLLTDLRKERKLSMQKLANAVGISAAYICRIESGERHPSRDILLKLIDELLPTGSRVQKDELMIAAGFAPDNFRNFMGRHDVLSIYERLVHEEPDNFKHYIALVLNLIRANKYEDALTRINQGMAKFEDMTQLQALMAALELSKDNFEQALVFQLEALKYAQESELSSKLGVGDVYLGLGVIYLMKGNALIYSAADLKSRGQSQQSQSQEAQAVSDLNQANVSFESALTHLPDDVYILDELARVKINLAYLSESQKAHQLWLDVVNIFERVVCAANKHEIGYENLIESISYLAYACVKCGDFNKAWFNINLVEACLPNYWMIHYIKANYYALLFDKEFAQDKPELGQNLLEHSILALESACSIQDIENQALSQAQVDPDLRSVREYQKKAYKALVIKWGGGTK